jgi:hypothetical protein
MLSATGTKVIARILFAKRGVLTQVADGDN